VDARVGNTTECDLGPAETHPSPSMRATLAMLEVGIRIVGPATDDEEDAAPRGRPAGAMSAQ